MAVIRWIIAFCVVYNACLHAVNADEPMNEAAGATSNHADRSDPIVQLVLQLNDVQFAIRESATRKLIDLGTAAIAPLALAVKSPDLEVRSRAYLVFETLWASGNIETREAIRKTLKDLAAGKNETASARAKMMLSRLEPTQQMNQRPKSGAFRNLIPLEGIFLGFAGRSKVKQVSIRNVNGVKDVEVQDGQLKVKIHETPNGEITMEVIQNNKDGKEKIENFRARDAAELKAQHPEAHKLYGKYAHGNSGIRLPITMPQLQIRAPQIQVLPGRGITVLPGTNQPQNDAINDGYSKTETVEEAIGSAAGNGKDTNESILESIEKLQESIDQMKEALEQSDKSR